MPPAAVDNSTGAYRRLRKRWYTADMKLTLRTTWTLALLMVGVLSAAIVAALYKGDSPLASVLLGSARSSQTGALASACVIPEKQTDDIFFISCGGIY